MDLRCLVAAAALVTATVAPLHADEIRCKLISAGTAAASYEQLGTAACRSLCARTEGCVAWTYQPHNFNPKTAPGECRLLPDVRSEEASTTKYCGRME